MSGEYFGKVCFTTTCLVPMDSRSDFQILQSKTIPVIYRLFVFIFRYLIFFNIIRKLLLFLNGQLYKQIRFCSDLFK